MQMQSAVSTPVAPAPLPAPVLLLGTLAATDGAMAALERNAQDPLEFVNRHLAFDWAELPPEDQHANRMAVQYGDRVLSIYTMADGEKLWIITEADRSCTTLLLPSEY